MQRQWLSGTADNLCTCCKEQYPASTKDGKELALFSVHWNRQDSTSVSRRSTPVKYQCHRISNSRIIGFSNDNLLFTTPIIFFRVITTHNSGKFRVLQYETGHNDTQNCSIQTTAYIVLTVSLQLQWLVRREKANAMGKSLTNLWMYNLNHAAYFQYMGFHFQSVWNDRVVHNWTQFTRT